MIWESHPWKEELHRIVDRPGRKAGQQRWTYRTDTNFADNGLLKWVA